jgi:hypothetical protein
MKFRDSAPEKRRFFETQFITTGDEISVKKVKPFRGI